MLAAVAGCSTAEPERAASPTADGLGRTHRCRRRRDPPSPSPIVATLGSLTGAWKGTWTNTSPQTAVGTFVLTWAQQGNLVFGAIGVTGSNCLSAGNVTGNLDGDEDQLWRGRGRQQRSSYEGVVSGTIMTGTYHSDCGNSKGTWTAVKA